jgi:hypothetical protein
LVVYIIVCFPLDIEIFVGLLSQYSD